jgi:exodeoxyribonuclease VII small subunit
MTLKKSRSPASAPAAAPAPESPVDGAEAITTSSFEDAMRRLSHIVEDLEGGALSLEESLARFEEGVRLARSSQARLDAAEARVEELMRMDEEGNPVVRDLDAD